MVDHGGLWWSNAFDHSPWNRSNPAAGRRDDSWPRLSGVRDACRGDRQSAGNCRTTRGHLCTFGDMLRVPGSQADLYRVKGAGGDVRIVYSPLDALKLASLHRDRQVVFFAIGFETTAPANAMAVKLARQQQLTNFSVLVSHVLVPPAIEAIMNSPGNRVQAFYSCGACV